MRCNKEFSSHILCEAYNCPTRHVCGKQLLVEAEALRIYPSISNITFHVPPFLEDLLMKNEMTHKIHLSVYDLQTENVQAKTE
jgi:hypothetical protein